LKTKSVFIFILLGGIVVALAGCGGGGGGGAAAPPVFFTKQQGTVLLDAGFAVAVDNTGNIYVVGETAGDLDGRINAGQTDIFLIKYDPQGIRLFTVLLGTVAAELDPRIALDNNGNVYVAGITNGTLDPGAASPGIGDLFVARMSPGNGAVVWLRQVGGVDNTVNPSPSIESNPSIAVDGAGNVYASCTTGGILDNAANLGAGTGVGTDFALAKFDSLGNRLWTRQHGTAANETAAGVAVSPAGNVYVGGDSGGIIDITTGSPGAGISVDLFVARFSSLGGLDWVRQRGTDFSEFATGIAVDGAGNAYVTGFTDGDLDGNVNAGAGTLDSFLVKFDASGNWQHTVQTGTSADGTTVLPFSVATDTAGNVYLAGATTGNLAGTGNAGEADAFLVKYNSVGVVQYTRQFGTAFLDSAFGVAVAPDGAVYLTGATFGDLDGHANTDPSHTSPDGFVAKFDRNGVRQ
jgi:hypothetical protein